jgi:hypothetical protein
MKRSSTTWPRLAGVISLAGVAIHIAAILGGASWFAFFGAPPAVVESARAGTLLAPLSTLAIAGAMALCAAYAFSAAGDIRRLPLLRAALASMAAICLLRALLLIPAAILRPELINTFEVVAAIVWGLAGVGFAVGFKGSRSA